MWPDRVSNPGPLTYESGALPTALRGPAVSPLSVQPWYIVHTQMSGFSIFFSGKQSLTSFASPGWMMGDLLLYILFYNSISVISGRRKVIMKDLVQWNGYRTRVRFSGRCYLLRK